MSDDSYHVFRRERARYYRTKSIEAEEAAARARSPDARDTFLKVAKDWLKLAEEIETELSS